MKALSKISLLYDVIRWEEKALYEAGKKLSEEIDMIDIKEELFDISKPLDKKIGDIVLQKKRQLLQESTYDGLLRIQGEKGRQLSKHGHNNWK